MRRVLTLALFALGTLFSTAAAVRVLRVEGAASVSHGFVAASRVLRPGDQVAIGDAISIGLDSYLDLRFEERRQLLRLLGGTAVTLDASEHENHRKTGTQITLLRGKVIGISSSTNNSYFLVRSEESSCMVQGPGRVDYVFTGFRAVSFSGSVLTMFALGTDRCRAHYSISPENGDGRKPAAPEITEQEAAFLKEQLQDLERFTSGTNKEKNVNGTPRKTREGKRITPL